MTKYFTKLDESNIVVQIKTVKDEVAPTEEAGVAYLANLTGHPNWKQTDKTNTVHKTGAGRGHTFDEARDTFIAPKPYPSWVLNETTCVWDPPIPYPDPINGAEWDEENQKWILRQENP